MTLPKNVVAVICDVDTAWKLHKELLEAGAPCLTEEERVFKASYKAIFGIGILWTEEVVCILMNHNAAALAVPMPEFRAAFDLPNRPQS